MNSTALAVIQSEELATIQEAAKLLALSDYFDGKGSTPKAIAMIATKIMAGREMGFGPFASANGIHIIQGKPSVGANLMAAAVKGNERYDYRVREMTAERCSIEFFERVGGKLESLGTSTFTKADANAAGTQNMGKFPRNMLFARAMSNGVRWYVPDVFNGNAVYVPEELGAEVDGDGNVIDTTYTVTKPNAEIDYGMGKQIAQNAPATSQQATGSDKATDAVDSPSNYATPLYAHLIDKLTGDCLERANRARKIHAQSKGPATPEQYRFLAGTIDDLVRQMGGHKAVLEVFVGRAVTSANPPGIQLAGKLLDALLEERTVERDGDKVKEANPDYNPEAVACVHSIYNLTREQDGQASLFEQEAQAQPRPEATRGVVA